VSETPRAAAPLDSGGEGPGRRVALGGGRRVPYPEPTSAAATAVARGNRRSGTKPEIALRSELHRRGRRFRKDHLLRVRGLRAHVDIVFTRQHVAVFVDGCFWHGCPDHQTVPQRNPEYWVLKLKANRERDARVDAALQAEGWRVLRIWEHEPPGAAADQVEAVLELGPQQ
jgi:DNA mismatch endonuclease (patch repair protein)